MREDIGVLGYLAGFPPLVFLQQNCPNRHRPPWTASRGPRPSLKCGVFSLLSIFYQSRHFGATTPIPTSSPLSIILNGPETHSQLQASWTGAVKRAYTQMGFAKESRLWKTLARWKTRRHLLRPRSAARDCGRVACWRQTAHAATTPARKPDFLQLPRKPQGAAASAASRTREGQRKSIFDIDWWMVAEAEEPLDWFPKSVHFFLVQILFFWDTFLPVSFPGYELEWRAPEEFAVGRSLRGSRAYFQGSKVLIEAPIQAASRERRRRSHNPSIQSIKDTVASENIIFSSSK